MARRAPIRILLVDDHPVVRDGIRAALAQAPHMSVCGDATGGIEAVALGQQLDPDVVIMDIGLPDINGLEATRLLVETRPQTRVVILTVYDNRESALKAARLGARGYLVKSSPAAVLLEAIETVHADRLFFPPELAEPVARELARRAPESEAAEPPELSGRERQVLTLVADGLSNREVAERLTLSVRTVEAHRERIMDKLEIRNVAGLTKYAIAEGFARIG